MRQIFTFGPITDIRINFPVPSLRAIPRTKIARTNKQWKEIDTGGDVEPLLKPLRFGGAEVGLLERFGEGERRLKQPFASLLLEGELSLFGLLPLVSFLEAIFLACFR